MLYDHDGSAECPVPEGVIVEVFYDLIGKLTGLVYLFNWDDITAYRIIGKEQEWEW